MIRRSIKIFALASILLVVVYIIGTLIRAAYLKRRHDRLGPCDERYTDTCDEGPFYDDYVVPKI